MSTPSFQSLLPAWIATASAVCEDRTQDLCKEERALIRLVSAPRRNDFSTGRMLARKTFSQFGFQLGPLLPDEHRQPRWPAGFLGSITHAGGHCALGLARERPGLIGFGIDLEPRARFQEDWWEAVLTPFEQKWVSSSDGGLMALRIFSLKEAIFKACAPLGNHGIDFQHIELQFSSEGGIEATPLAELVERLPTHAHFELDSEVCANWIRSVAKLHDFVGQKEETVNPNQAG